MENPFTESGEFRARSVGAIRGRLFIRWSATVRGCASHLGCRQPHRWGNPPRKTPDQNRAIPRGGNLRHPTRLAQSIRRQAVFHVQLAEGFGPDQKGGWLRRTRGQGEGGKEKEVEALAGGRDETHRCFVLPPQDRQLWPAGGTIREQIGRAS